MTPDGIAFAAHVDALCKKHEIGVQYKKGGNESAWTDERRIRVRPIRSERSYCGAMHEIGHILGKWRDRPCLVEETGAWLWAKRWAIRWSPEMDAVMRVALGAYLHNEKLKADGYVPPKGHEFWRLLGG